MFTHTCHTLISRTWYIITHHHAFAAVRDYMHSRLMSVTGTEIQTGAQCPYVPGTPHTAHLASMYVHVPGTWTPVRLYACTWYMYAHERPMCTHRYARAYPAPTTATTPGHMLRGSSCKPLIAYWR